MDQLSIVSRALSFFPAGFFSQAEINPEKGGVDGWKDRLRFSKQRWGGEGWEKGRINKMLRPLSALQVVFLPCTFAAYVTV